MYYYIYKITNINSKKFYIGSHKTKSLDDGYFGSGLYLKRSIKKHGKEMFVKEIICYCQSEAELRITETSIIQSYKSDNIYNLKLCAVGGNTRESYSDEKKKKYIAKLIANPKSPIGKRGSANFHLGKSASQETKDKMKVSRFKWLNSLSVEDRDKWITNVINKSKLNLKKMAEKISKKVEAVDIRTDVIRVFDSKAAFVREMKISMGTLNRHLSDGTCFRDYKLRYI